MTPLPQIPILSGLKDVALELLAKEAAHVVVPAGEFVVREGETGNQMFLISSGMVRVLKHCGNPGQIELATLRDGDFFGEGCILNPLPRVASVQAVTDAVLFRVSSMTFYHLYQKHPEQYGILLLNLARDLSRRLRRLDEVFAACH